MFTYRPKMRWDIAVVRANWPLVCLVVYSPAKTARFAPQTFRLYFHGEEGYTT
jgi:hypothetical protein